MDRFIRRAAAFALVAGTLAGTSGCFGSFNITRKVYGFNKTASPNKFVRELVFLGLNVVPVYGIAAFADAIVANSVEFWTGKNPVMMSSTIKVNDKTTVERVMTGDDVTRTMTIRTYESGRPAGTVTVRYISGADFMTFTSLTADGKSETHVSALASDGTAFVSAGTYGDLVKNNYVAVTPK